MKILAIGANPKNGRDGIIVRGIVNLFPDAEITYKIIDDHNSQHPWDFSSPEKFDKIIYCGTPFLWDQMFDTHKVKNTLLCRKAHPKAEMIWLGIGSCLNLGQEYSGILRSEKEQALLRETFANSKVIVRDSLANQLLTLAGVENELLPCPSFFSIKEQSDKSQNTLFFHDPTTGISKDIWLRSPTVLDWYFDQVKSFMQNHKPVIYVAEQEDAAAFDKRFPGVPFLYNNTVDKTIQAVLKSNKVLSGRVHNAVPALLAGASVELLATDSRAKTFEEFKNITAIQLAEIEKRYKEILK